VSRVVKGGLRPKMPPGTPAAFDELAKSCWQADPKQRPKFDEVVRALRSMRTWAEPHLLAGGGVGGASPPRAV
jgi:hypothetical protein